MVLPHLLYKIKLNTIAASLFCTHLVCISQHSAADVVVAHSQLLVKQSFLSTQIELNFSLLRVENFVFLNRKYVHPLNVMLFLYHLLFNNIYPML